MSKKNSTPSSLVAFFFALAISTSADATSPFVDVVYGREGSYLAYRLSARGQERQETAAITHTHTPLGSVWKLFVFAYLEGTESAEKTYRCEGKNIAEESYCCDPGKHIDRKNALIQSCSLYFEPSRLGINAKNWREFWQREHQNPPDWLLDLSNIKPQTRVSVGSLLTALDFWKESLRKNTADALQRTTLTLRARPLLRHVGNALFVKTWSWFDEEKQRLGGFSGWLVDGTPIWLGGRGVSAEVIERAAPWLAEILPAQVPEETTCVVVQFFTRYPINYVLLDGKQAPEGTLRGHLSVYFQNGQHRDFISKGDMRLSTETGRLRISGRFGLEDYVARVIVREGTEKPEEAARALAVAARTYLVRHGGFDRGCYEINDDSAYQRVSPDPPTALARRIAYFSSPLILEKADGRYHASMPSSLPEAPRLVWSLAVNEAKNGKDWEDILRKSYGNTGFLTTKDTESRECYLLSVATNWLQKQEAKWRKTLQTIDGFELPSPAPVVCRLDMGVPYADVAHGRIYAQGISSSNERLSLAHEYLHLALANHPKGGDEEFVEHTARQLLGIP